MNHGLRWIMLLSLIIGFTTSCNRTMVQSHDGAIVYKDDTLTVQPAPRDPGQKLQLDVTPTTALATTKSGVEASDMAYNYKIARIDSLVNAVASHGGFNGTVLVGSRGKVIYKKASGYTDFSTREELETNSIFQLASVSKQFTAMCIMMLKQDGKLSYEDELTQYFPQLPYKGITIRNLLNHTSGLPNYMFVVEAHSKVDNPPYNTEIIDMLAKYHPAVYFKPGQKFLYSNTGYMLLASIVEKVSGMEFMDFAESRIFSPLGMSNSFVYCSSKVCQYKKHVTGYKPSRRGYYKVGEDVLNGSVGDKGVHSTVEDLFKWDQALYTDKLVKQETLAEAFTKGRLNSHKEIDYGFGFRLVERNGRRIIYHNGLWNGFRSGIVRDVANNLTVIVLNSTNSAGKHVVENGITKILNDEEAAFLVGTEGSDDAAGSD